MMNEETAARRGDEQAGATYSLWQLVRYMLALGTWGFGGPGALVG